MSEVHTDEASSSVDDAFMQLAIEEGERAVVAGEVPVGCVYVRGGKVVASGFNATNAELDASRHAELVAADALLVGCGESSDYFSECDLYVTCEPCLMCAAALGRLGIRRVIFGCFNDRFGGCGSILSLHVAAPHTGGRGYPIKSGVMKEEAVALFRRFYARENARAPETKRKRKGEESQEAAAHS